MAKDPRVRGDDEWEVAAGRWTRHLPVRRNSRLRPLVALVAPRLSVWARRNRVSASPYLMPLSFAAVLGGVVTVIGTSTNLVVSDLLSAQGEDALGIFEITLRVEASFGSS
mgnify:CR=1 FL=1